MFEEFSNLVGLIELGGVASLAGPDNRNARNGILAQKQLAILICQHEGLLLEVKNKILERKPIVEQEALTNVFYHIDPEKVTPQVFSTILQICAESLNGTAKMVQSLTRFANHPSSKDLAYPLIINLLRGNLEYRFTIDQRDRGWDVLASPTRISCLISYTVTNLESK